MQRTFAYALGHSIEVNPFRFSASADSYYDRVEWLFRAVVNLPFVTPRLVLNPFHRSHRRLSHHQFKFMTFSRQPTSKRVRGSSWYSFHILEISGPKIEMCAIAEHENAYR